MTGLWLRDDWADWEQSRRGRPSLCLSFNSNPGPAPGNVEIDDSLRLLVDLDEQVRAKAIRELGRLKAYRAVDALKSMVSDDPSPPVREAAARSLGLIGTKSLRARTALFALEKVAREDSDPKVRHAAEFAAEIIQLAEE